MKLTIKNYRPAPNIGPEGGAFSATLYADGKRVAIVSNDGWGGCNRYDPVDRARFAEVEAFAEAQHLTYEMDGETHEVTTEKLDWVIDEMIEAEEERKWFRRQCKGKTLFRVDGDGPDEWRTVKHRWCPEVEQFIAAKYGDAVVEIANETRL